MIMGKAVHKPRSVAALLILGISAVIVLICLVGGLIHCRIVLSRLQERTRQEAEDFARKIAGLVREPLWNLDSGRIHAILNGVPTPHGLVTIGVTTEYSDPVWRQRYRMEEEAFGLRQEVRGHGQAIGYIEVGFSGEEAAWHLGMLARSLTAVVGTGVLVCILLVTVLTRVILGRPLRAVGNHLQQIAGGKYAQRLEPSRYAEIDVINQSANDMAEQVSARTRQLQEEVAERRRAEKDLLVLKDSLEEQVNERTRDLRRAYEELRRESGERRRVEAEMATISTREQRRIGRDIHDSLGQLLAGGAYMGASLVKELRRIGSPGVEEAEQLTKVIGDSLRQARQIAHGLAPVDAPDLDLADALRGFAHDVESLYGMSCRLRSTSSCRVKHVEIATHLYRIVQEAVHNAREHGKATEVMVTLSMVNGTGKLVVEDNGSGVEQVTGWGAGMGVRIMRRRAELSGGCFKLEPREEGGTRIEVTFVDAGDPAGEASEETRRAPA